MRDAGDVLAAGAWQHRFVSANGARFHIAEAGPADGPLVLLLHGFPQFWWCWRHVLPALGASGWRAVAADLRGYGASDKPPRGYDTVTLAADVAGLVGSLGASSARVVGHDWGAWIAWAMPALAPRQTRAVAALSMAHPLCMRSPAQLRASAFAVAYQVPFRAERQLSSGREVERVLNAWSAAGYPDAESLTRYRAAVGLPFVAHSALEYFRWVARSQVRPDWRRFAAAVAVPVGVPVLQLHGSLDPCVLPSSARSSRAQVAGPYRYDEVARAGHFLPEEAPDIVVEALLEWLPTT